MCICICSWLPPWWGIGHMCFYVNVFTAPFAVGGRRHMCMRIGETFIPQTIGSRRQATVAYGDVGMAASRKGGEGCIKREACVSRRRFQWRMCVAHPGKEARTWSPPDAEAWAWPSWSVKWEAGGGRQWETWAAALAERRPGTLPIPGRETRAHPPREIQQPSCARRQATVPVEA